MSSWWILAWWATGTISFLIIPRGSQRTWGELTIALLMGFLGPLILVAIAFAILVRAEFWSKPIFKRRR